MRVKSHSTEQEPEMSFPLLNLIPLTFCAVGGFLIYKNRKNLVIGYGFALAGVISALLIQIYIR